VTEPTSATALIFRPIAIDATRIPSTPPGVPSHSAEIAAAVRAIAERFDPDRVILFGSRAYGTPRPDGDIDLLVVMRTPFHAADQAQRIRLALPPQSGPRVQVLVRDPNDIAIRLAEGDSFVQDIVGNGIGLYARSGLDATPSFWPVAARRKRNKSHITLAVREWLQTAASDAETARFLMTAPSPNLNHVCFHAQQSVEKNLKAILENDALPVPRVHDFANLADLITPTLSALTALRSELDTLTTCAVDPRYPGAVVTPSQADAALAVMDAVASIVAATIGPLSP